MFKTILKVFRAILQAFKKVTWKGVEFWTPIVIFFTAIVWGISGMVYRNDDPYKSWENAAVCSTLVYTCVILVMGLRERKFKGVTPKQGLLSGALLIFIFYLAFSILQKKLGFFQEKLEELGLLDEHLHRAGIMLLYLGISICYVVIDYILIKTDISKNEINEIKNSVLYCDGPTGLVFLVLLIFASISHFQKVNEVNDTFFTGAIAFQMILASIVWWLIDNSQRLRKLLF